MSGARSAIVTVAFGHATEHLDYTFSSFAMNQGVPLHAFIVANALPQRRLPNIEYHLVAPIPDFSHPLREIYFRRLELIDQLDVDYALVVDSYDVLCLQPLPPLAQLLGDADVAACVEMHGTRYILGQGCTNTFLNGGVFFWNVPRSRDIRAEIVARGRAHFRTVADDQHCINEVIHTKHYHRLRILPDQYNFRCFLKPAKQRGFPSVDTLDGVMIYHNSISMDAVKKLPPVKPRAALPDLVPDGRPLTPSEQFRRRLRNKFKPWIVK
jgi:hypothetical protein